MQQRQTIEPHNHIILYWKVTCIHQTHYGKNMATVACIDHVNICGESDWIFAIC